MKVNFNSHLVHFNDIDTGEVFRADDYTYIRITSTPDLNNYTYNAVCLETGTVVSFDDDDIVSYYSNAELSLGW